jgi:hypothetical protein
MIAARALMVRLVGCAVILAGDGSLGASSAASILEALQNGAVIRVQQTDCHVGPIRNPVTLTSLLSYRDGMLFEQGLGSPGHYSPWSRSYPINSAAGGTPRRSSTVTADSITITEYTTETFRLSADGASCTYEAPCPEGRNGRIISCTVQAGGGNPSTASPAAPAAPTMPAASAMPKSASCSDITGLGGGGSTARNCKTGNALVAAARALRARDPKAAAEKYKQAADAYRRAGDGQLAATTRDAATAMASAAADTHAGPAATPSESSPRLNDVAAAAPAAAPSGPGPHWQGTSDPRDCANANFVERSSAAWGVMCVPAQSVTGHKPEPDPLVLSEAARKACGSWSRETRRCYGEVKLKLILAQNPAFRQACNDAARSSGLGDALRRRIGSDQDPDRLDTPFNRCVDDAYLYGLHRPAQDLRELLKKRLAAHDAATSDSGNDGPRRPSSETLPHDGCPRGQGLQPDRHAFGAWTCQPLTTVVPDRNMPAHPSGDGETADAIDRAEAELDDVAATTAAAIAEALGAQLSPQDRATCANAAAAAARGAMTDTHPPAPPVCGPMIEAVRPELAYYARTRVPLDEPGLDAFLAYLGMRDPRSGGTHGGNLGAPLPGMTGLEPSAQDRLVADCIVRGGTREQCLSALAARASAAAPAADCSLAETHWKSAEEIKTLEAYADHLARFPDCPFATLARARIEALKKKK